MPRIFLHKNTCYFTGDSRMVLLLKPLIKLMSFSDIAFPLLQDILLSFAGNRMFFLSYSFYLYAALLSSWSFRCSLSCCKEFSLVKSILRYFLVIYLPSVEFPMREPTRFIQLFSSKLECAYEGSGTISQRLPLLSWRILLNFSSIRIASGAFLRLTSSPIDIN